MAGSFCNPIPLILSTPSNGSEKMLFLHPLLLPRFFWGGRRSISGEGMIGFTTPSMDIPWYIHHHIIAQKTCARWWKVKKSYSLPLWTSSRYSFPSAALRYFRFLAAASPGLRGDGASSYVDSVQRSGSGALPENAAGLVGKDGEFCTIWFTNVSNACRNHQNWCRRTCSSMFWWSLPQPFPGFYNL